jgi:phage terminase large subunit GpA-like protein
VDDRRCDLQERDVPLLTLATPTDEEIATGAKFPVGYVHLACGTDAEWVKQLVGEQLVTVKTKRGFSRLEWQKLRERNEALDCRVHARAAAWIAGADRWTEVMWRDLESQVGIGEVARTDERAEVPADSIAGVVRRRTERRGRRVLPDIRCRFRVASVFCGPLKGRLGRVFICIICICVSV